MALHNDIFRQQIWEFFCNDLDSCLQVSRLKQSDTSRFPGGLNFTAALVIFSVIEFCAAFHKGGEVNQTEIAEFLNKYFRKHDPLFYNFSFCKEFYNVFRNGLSHQWSPKASGIAMDFGRTEILMVGSPDSGERIPFLNIPSLFSLTKRALVDFESDLNGDTELRQKFESRYKEIVDRDYQEMRKLRKLLEFVPGPEAIIPSSSGATGPANPLESSRT